MSTPDQTRGRLRRIIEQLTAHTTANEITWEMAAMPDSFAVTVGEVRFRIRTVEGNESAPYVLEFLGRGANFGPMITEPTVESEEDQRVARLYEAARSSAWANTPDPLFSVEKQLGIPESGES